MEKERNILQKDQSATASAKESKRNTNSQKSLDQHYAALRELLEAARDNYRLSMTEGLSMKLEVAGGQPPAELINISTRGAAVKISESPKPPLQNSPVKLHLSLPGIAKTYLIEAKVVWIQPDPSGIEDQFALGLKFLNTDKALQQRLFQYIFET
ncbi:MAG: PilZ domain-containing protein, partial [Desulfuromonadales bacterium]